MYDSLLHLMLKQRALLAGLMLVASAAILVICLWIYAELVFWKQRKVERIEAMRDIMDGIELRRRRQRKNSSTSLNRSNSLQAHRINIASAATSGGSRTPAPAGAKVIQLANLDATDSQANIKYSKIKISAHNRRQIEQV